MNTTTLEEARAAKPRVQALLRGVPELRGVGITRVESGYGVKVNLSAHTTGAALPHEIGGVPIRVEVVGAVLKRAGR